MKKIVIAICMFAAGFLWQPAGARSQQVFTMVCAVWTARADGTVEPIRTSEEMTKRILGSFVCGAETIPGFPWPTRGYDVEVVDEHGVDLFGGRLHKRAAMVAQIARPQIGSWPATGDITIKITKNRIAGAQGIVKIFLSRVSAAGSTK